MAELDTSISVNWISTFTVKWENFAKFGKYLAQNYQSNNNYVLPVRTG